MNRTICVTFRTGPNSYWTTTVGETVFEAASNALKFLLIHFGRGLARTQKPFSKSRLSDGLKTAKVQSTCGSNLGVAEGKRDSGLTGFVCSMRGDPSEWFGACAAGSGEGIL